MYQIYLLQQHFGTQWVNLESFTTESRYFDLAKNDVCPKLREDGGKEYVFSAERMLSEYHKGGSGSWRETIHNLVMSFETPNQVIRAIKKEFWNDTNLKDTYWEELEFWVLKIIDTCDVYDAKVSELKFLVMEIPQ